MLTDAANIIFQTAKRRCYTLSRTNADLPPAVIDVVDDEDAWDALDDIQGRGKRSAAKSPKPWIPEGMDPVLEELPKWDLLADVLHEIEEEIMRQESLSSCESSLSLTHRDGDTKPFRRSWLKYRFGYDIFPSVLRSGQ